MRSLWNGRAVILMVEKVGVVPTGDA